MAVEETVAHELWKRCREELLERLADCFPRRETRRTCGDMLDALTAMRESANCWSLAETIGDATPDRLQHFLSRASWDEAAAMDRLAGWAVGHLGGEQVVLAVDETGDAKSSTDAVGAARQYSGSLGGVGLCQVAVHLSYATAAGHTLIDRRLYLPEGWAGDEERRELAGVPDQVEFATKPQLAAEMLDRVDARGLREAFVAADEVYGGRELRRHIRTLGYGYAIAVKTSHRVTTPAGSSMASELAKLLPARSWQRLRTGTGGKGDRHYDWAVIDVLPDDTPDPDEPDEPGPGSEAGTAASAGFSMLLIRRHRYTRTLSFYRCWSPAPRPLRVLVSVVCRRWRIEEEFQAAKGLTGLDQGQVIRWTSWHRWSLMSMLAYALLAVSIATERRVTSADTTSADVIELVPVSCRELVKLLRILVLDRPGRDGRRVEHAAAWSHWRRRHQRRAQICHRRWNEVTAAAIT